MSDSFKHYCPLSKETLEDIWNNGIIILDANVLLDLYRLPQTQCDETLKLFEHEAILKRIWVPYQAAREFYQNRLTVIHDQFRNADKLRDMVRGVFENFKNYDFRRYHPFIDKSEWPCRTIH